MYNVKWIFIYNSGLITLSYFIGNAYLYLHLVSYPHGRRSPPPPSPNRSPAPQQLDNNTGGLLFLPTLFDDRVSLTIRGSTLFKTSAKHNIAPCAYTPGVPCHQPRTSPWRLESPDRVDRGHYGSDTSSVSTGTRLRSAVGCYRMPERLNVTA